MSRIQINKKLIFLGTDLTRPRMLVEKEKMNRSFPGFQFYSKGNEITAVKGYLRTNFSNSYYVNIHIPDNYPYDMPIISLPNHTIDSLCSHVYNSGNICVMKSEQWSSTLSLALLVAKVALWLNKYDNWKKNGRVRWPGTDQHK